MSHDPNAAATTFRRDEIEIACAMFAKASVGTDIGVLQRSAAGVRLHRKFLMMRGRLEGPGIQGKHIDQIICEEASRAAR